jgi:hypothetical protein
MVQHLRSKHEDERKEESANRRKLDIDMLVEANAEEAAKAYYSLRYPDKAWSDVEGGIRKALIERFFDLYSQRGACTAHGGAGGASARVEGS